MSIIIVNIFVKSENEAKKTLSLIYIVDGRVLNVNNTDIKKLWSKLIFSNVSTNEKATNIKIYNKRSKLQE